jgi:phosphatidylserine decarboxylase
VESRVPFVIGKQTERTLKKDWIARLRIVRDGIPFIFVPALLGAVAFVFGYWPVGLFFALITLFMAYFFRDPNRELPVDPNLVVSPADGRVTLVKELAAEQPDSAKLVSIFLSPFDVHINRAPIGGRITDITYAKGKFLMATNANASLMNEQNILTIEGEKITVVCKQIAGILARRIVCWKKKGERVMLGERFGLIKFSSRTDVILPGNVDVLVSEGMKVKGGTSIIGRIR